LAAGRFRKYFLDGVPGITPKEITGKCNKERSIIVFTAYEIS